MRMIRAGSSASLRARSALPAGSAGASPLHAGIIAPAMVLGGASHVWEMHSEFVFLVCGLLSVLVLLSIALAVRMCRFQQLERQLRESEKQLRATNENLQATWNALPDLAFEVGEDGRILGFNAGSPELLYVPPVQFLGKRIAEFLPEAATKVLMEGLAHAKAKGHFSGGVYSLDLTDGEQWFEFSIAAKGDACTGERSYVLLARCITERKRMEEQLLASEQRLRLLTMASFDGIAITENGRFVDVNDQLLELLGYNRGEFIGLEVGSLLPAKDKERVMHNILECVESSTEHEMIRKDGSLVAVECHGRTTSINGTSVRFTSVRDITKRKQAEAQSSGVRQRLARAGRLQLMGELSASLAHELNQPLTAVLSNAQAGQRFLALPKADLGLLAEILEDIVKESKRASDVIGTLRALLASQRTDFEPLQLNDLAQETLQLFQGEALLKEIEIVLELEPNLPEVLGSRILLSELILNLVMNAIEAIKAQPPELPRRLSIRTESGKNGSITVSVSDTGPGIASETLPRLFDSFFTTKKDGLGLGLSICQSIVQAHRGRIWALNNSEAGATFHFSLPALARSKP